MLIPIRKWPVAVPYCQHVPVKKLLKITLARSTFACLKLKTIPLETRQNARNGRHAADRYQGSEHNDDLTDKNTEIEEHSLPSYNYEKQLDKKCCIHVKLQLT